MRLRILSIVPLLALTLAACGGGGSKSSTTTSAPTTATSAPSSTPAGSDPAATARAQKLVLVQADFPAGWTGTPAAADTPDQKAANQEFETCAGVSGDADRSADVKGDDFSMGSPVTQVGSEAQIVKDESTYRKDVTAIKGSKFQTCLKDLLTKALQQASGSAPTNVQLSPIAVATYGDVTFAQRLTGTISAQGQTANVVVDLVLIAKNRAEVLSTFINLAQPFDQALEKNLIGKLGAKLDA